MISTDAKVGLVLGHPGHELRVFRFLEIYKPRVYVLTDGSGNTGKSRLDRTLAIIEQAGATVSPVMGRFTDHEIYDIMKRGDSTTLCAAIDEILTDMQQHNIDTIAGDCIEGFNPTHDLCRYMINSLVKKFERIKGLSIPNFEFYLDGPPHLCPEGLKEKSLWIKLSDEDFDRKYEACKNYPEIVRDLEELIGKHGKAPFQVECLWPVQDSSAYQTWSSPEPFYETYGKKKVETGEYKELIAFESHLLPLGKHLSNFALK